MHSGSSSISISCLALPVAMADRGLSRKRTFPPLHSVRLPLDLHMCMYKLRFEADLVLTCHPGGDPRERRFDLCCVEEGLRMFLEIQREFLYREDSRVSSSRSMIRDTPARSVSAYLKPTEGWHC